MVSSLLGFTTKTAQVLNFFVSTTRTALCPSPSLSLVWLTVLIFRENYKLYSSIFLCNCLKPLFNSFLPDMSIALDTSVSAVLKVHSHLESERIRSCPATLQNSRQNRTLYAKPKQSNINNEDLLFKTNSKRMLILLLPLVCITGTFFSSLDTCKIV